MNSAYSHTLLGLVCALAAPLALAACASDNGPSGADAGEDSGPSTGGKSGGTGGHAGSGGSAGKTAAGGSAGNGGSAGSSMCTVTAGTECDGPEDCPTGQHCCGEYNGSGAYDRFSCMASCTADAGAGLGGGPLLFELCHGGDTCEDSTAMCLTSPYLPMSLSRCLPAMLVGQTMGAPPDASLGKAAHAVNCGSAVCGSGEECCVRQPLAPYCAPKGTACSCDHVAAPDAGTNEGGVTVKDGGVPDATAPSDAGSNHD